MKASSTVKRIRICVSGIVQGVGFRPFICNLALAHSLVGFVRNLKGSVEIEAQGDEDSLSSFVREITDSAPRLAGIKELTVTQLADSNRKEATFAIVDSIDAGGNDPFIVPDTATCDECISEMFDPGNRRYRYPFINCVNCGPRFTIISSLPYDRKNTTMACFHMCKPCHDEYFDQTNRRFHAEPNACHVCGPALAFIDGVDLDRHYGKVKNENRNAINENGNAINAVVNAINDGKIIALKGLGGFQLLCDATSDDAVRKLRQRKRRQEKPFAVMIESLKAAREYCYISESEASLLASGERPIVLIRSKENSTLSKEVAPSLDRLGVMLPMTGVHHLIMEQIRRPIVATSGNLTEESIAKDNLEALDRLRAVADAFLVNDREIYSRYDDSVVQISESGHTITRRARGYAPRAIRLPFSADSTVLAVGGHLKNTFCLTRKENAFLSQHLGDLDNLDTLNNFNESLETYIGLFSAKPSVIAHDLHPDYLSTSLAKELAERFDAELVAVQHHHAHIASCLAEHRRIDRVIGVAFDGTGYGLDGKMWGGEFLTCTMSDFTREFHLDYAPMPGGNLAVKAPWRMALGFLRAAKLKTSRLNEIEERFKSRYGNSAVRQALAQMEKGINSPMTSSIGRLFDSVSALLGICEVASYEGQAPMLMESIARLCSTLDPPYRFKLTISESENIIEYADLLDEMLSDMMNGVAPSAIAHKFHLAVAALILEVCCRLRSVHQISTVCLSGGVFQNQLLVDEASKLLAEAGFEVLLQREVPPNDGGLSLGQAAVAAARLAKQDIPVLEETPCA